MTYLTLSEPVASVAPDSPPAIASYLYGLFGESFNYPDDELVLMLKSGNLCRIMEELLPRLHPEVTTGVDMSGLVDKSADLETLSIEYTRLFDANSKGTACPLNGGLYSGSQMKFMEESVRFYDHFGLTLAEQDKELPDHLATQLNFLHFLSYVEADLLRAGLDAAAYQKAQRDFIARHPGRWLPRMVEKLAAANSVDFFQTLSILLLRLLQHEQARLECLHGKASLEMKSDLGFLGH